MDRLCPEDPVARWRCLYAQLPIFDGVQCASGGYGNGHCRGSDLAGVGN